MVGPIVAGAVYSLLVIVLGFFRPNTGRIFLGIFFLAMGIGVNLSFLITQPTFVTGLLAMVKNRKSRVKERGAQYEQNPR